jgi:hypothetical protein
MRRILSTVLIGLVLSGGNVRAASFYVDNVSGDDSFGGRLEKPDGEGGGPFRTISRALEDAGAGDTVHLNPTDQLYRQAANLYEHPGGEEGQPLTLDGHGTTLCGADPVSADGWKEWQDGVFQRNDMVPRGFIVVDGEMVFGTIGFNVLRPGEFIWLGRYHGRLYFYPPKGRKAGECRVEVTWPDGETEVLDPKTWHRSHSRIGAVRRYPMKKRPRAVRLDGEDVTLIATKDRLKPGQWVVEEGTVYYRPPEGTHPSEMEMQFVIRGNGVQMTGDTAHVVVKNLNVRWVYNDGYNIHGHVTDARFYNCNARDTGDEGFSAHDACETLLDGAVYVNNSNGIANVNRSGHSITRNVVLARARDVGYLILTGGKGPDQVHHVLEKAVLIDNRAQINASNTRLKDVLAISTAGGSVGRSIGAGRDLELHRVTVIGGRVRAGTAPVHIEDSVLECNFHVRADTPLKVLRLRNVILRTGAIIEWGSRYPWTRKKAGEWLEDAAKAGAAKDCRTGDLEFLDALSSGEEEVSMSEGVGCSTATWEMYREVILDPGRISRSTGE